MIPTLKSELKHFFQGASTRPKKSYSQNFLIDQNIIRKIINLAQVDARDTILEIGPGLGAITKELLAKKARVIAIEKDPLFQPVLETLPHCDTLTIKNCDFLDFPLSSLSLKAPIKIIANVPFHITAPILEKLCEHYSLFSTAFLWVQKELADRLLAQSGSKKMSTLTLFVQLYAKTSLVMHTSSSSFYPAPKVDTSVLRLDFHPPKLQHPKLLMQTIHTAYRQRRKMLRSTIGLEGPLSHLRPEDLSLDDWIALLPTQAASTTL